MTALDGCICEARVVLTAACCPDLHAWCLVYIEQGSQFKQDTADVDEVKVPMSRASVLCSVQ